jgi:hypothetical protein
VGAAVEFRTEQDGRGKLEEMMTTEQKASPKSTQGALQAGRLAHQEMGGGAAGIVMKRQLGRPGAESLQQPHVRIS